MCCRRETNVETKLKAKMRRTPGRMITAYKSLKKERGALHSHFAGAFPYRSGINVAEGKLDLSKDRVSSGAFHVWLSRKDAVKQIFGGHMRVIPVRCREEDFIGAGHWDSRYEVKIACFKTLEIEPGVIERALA